MKVHKLKTLHEYFVAQVIGTKQFEVRYNDRDFHVGDVLVLNEWSNEIGYTATVLYVWITYILDNFKGLKDGYVVLGTEQLTKEEIEEVLKNGKTN